MRQSGRIGLAAVLALTLWTVDAVAQEGKSVAAARDLAAALDAGSLDSIAAQDPAAPDAYVAALYFKGGQILVVAARYSQPSLLATLIAKKDYRNVYMDLTSASIADSKIFVQDMLADGLRAKSDDSCEAGGKTITFNGDFKKQKITEDEYSKAYASAESRYAQLLVALTAQAKK